MFENRSGAELAAALARVDVRSLDADEALDFALAMRRVQAWSTAGEVAGLAHLADRYPVPERTITGQRAVNAEVAAAYGCSTVAAGNRVALAQALASLPRTAAALPDGEIDVPRAWIVVDSLQGLVDPAARAEVEQALLTAHAAAESGLTTRQWRVRLRRAVAEIDPTAAEARQQASRAERRVSHRPPARAGDPGALVLTGPAEQVSQCEEAIDDLARTWWREARTASGCGRGPESGPGRRSATLEELRFDAAVYLLTHGPEGRVPDGTVVAQVTVPLSALLGCDDAPGELDGVGPVPASVARELAARAGVWWRLLTDPVDGHVVTQEVKRYRPTEAMRRFVRARAGGVCQARGSGARRGLQDDHVVAHPFGPTSATNLVPLSVGWHLLKTHGGWLHELDPRTGALRQTSPLGRTYVTEPTPPPGSTGRSAGPVTCAECIPPPASLADERMRSPRGVPPDADVDPWPAIEARLREIDLAEAAAVDELWASLEVDDGFLDLIDADERAWLACLGYDPHDVHQVVG